MKDKKSKDFTHREVAVLIEELRSEFRSVSEGLKDLRDKLEGVQENQAKTLEKITGIELRLIRIENDFGKRIAALEASRK